MPSVIVVEDDAELRELTVRGLREEGFAAIGVAAAVGLARRLEQGTPDVLVIDIGLPDADGRDLCQALRVQGLTTPVLFLTARDAVPDRVSGFAAGGDDYLVKPFALAELIARLHSLLRRAPGSREIRVAGLRVDPATRAATCGESTVELTPTEFRLLAALASQPGEVLTRRALAQIGWGHGASVGENTLDSYVARIRRKLADLPGAPRVHTVRGTGYRLA